MRRCRRCAELTPHDRQLIADCDALAARIDEGKAAYDGRPVAIHQNDETGAFMLVPAHIPPGLNVRAILRLFRRGTGEWVEMPLKPDGWPEEE